MSVHSIKNNDKFSISRTIGRISEILGVVSPSPTAPEKSNHLIALLLLLLFYIVFIQFMYL